MNLTAAQIATLVDRGEVVQVPLTHLPDLLRSAKGLGRMLQWAITQEDGMARIQQPPKDPTHV